MTPLTDDERALETLCARLRQLRAEHGWTLGDLATRTGLSQAHLSRVESGERQPSLAALFTLARAFAVPVSALLDLAPVTDGPVILRAGSVPAKQINGLLYTPLSVGGGQLRFQAAHVRVPQHRQGAECYQHEGEEWLYVLSGTLQLLLGDQSFVLEAGDVAHFDSSVSHRLAAHDMSFAEALLVTSAGAEPLKGAHT
jgi:transcriptional regulator with XRE-family HTH domain